jgi:hypothetical protein
MRKRASSIESIAQIIRVFLSVFVRIDVKYKCTSLGWSFSSLKAISEFVNITTVLYYLSHWKCLPGRQLDVVELLSQMFTSPARPTFPEQWNTELRSGTAHSSIACKQTSSLSKQTQSLTQPIPLFEAEVESMVQSMLQQDPKCSPSYDENSQPAA